MLSAKLIYFSRTLTRDYRWIFVDEHLDHMDIKNILHDYDAFERNDGCYDKKHLIVRLTSRGMAFYKFETTERVDIYSRRILAIKGFSFSDFDGEIANKLLAYVGGYLLFDFIPNHTLSEELNDSIVEATMPIEFSLDSIVEYCRQNELVVKFVEKVYHFIQQYPNSAYCLTGDSVTCIHSDDGLSVADEQNMTDGSISLEEAWNGVNALASQEEFRETNDVGSDKRLKKGSCIWKHIYSIKNRFRG